MSLCKIGMAIIILLAFGLIVSGVSADHNEDSTILTTPGAGWLVTLDIASGEFNQSVIMGVNESGTRGYDSGLDIPAPPDPPGPAPQKAVYFTCDNLFFDRLSSDFKPLVTEANPAEFWDLVLKSNEPISVYWDTSGITLPILQLTWTNGSVTESMRVVPGTNLPAGTYSVNISAVLGTTPPPPPFPVANFTASPTSGKVPLMVNFTDQSTGDPAEWLWNFGDNSTSEEPHPTHTYTTPGTYNITLTATNAGGSDTLERDGYITVTAPSPSPNTTAVLEFNVNHNRGTSGDVLMRGTGDCRIGYYTGVHNSPQSEGTINGSISFLLDAAEVVHQSVFPASYAEINGTEVRWNFPEITEIKPGTTLSTSAATSTFIPRESGVTIERRTNRTQFSDAGVQDAVFNITFDTIHPDGLWGRIEAANTSDVSASFIPGTVQTDLPLFGLNEGLHRIEYRINTTMIEAGNQYFISAAVAVEPTQPVMFAPSIGVWETINFTRTAAPEGTMVTVPHILLPDNVSNVSFSSATPCTWEMARNEHIISSITQRSDLVVPSPPSAAFTATPTSGAAGFTVRFNDTSTGEPTSWFWDLGDGTNSTDQHPVHTYTTPGTYSVRLTASNAVGSDTVTEQALIIVHIRGDFNGNGRVDIGDVAKVAWMAIGLMEPDPAANFKGDGEVDSADAARIAYYYVGKIPAL